MTRADASIGARMTLEREWEELERASQRHLLGPFFARSVRRRHQRFSFEQRDPPPACRPGGHKDSAAGELLLTLAAAVGRGQGISSAAASAGSKIGRADSNAPLRVKFVPNQ